MDVFLMIRRKKQTIFTDCKESTTVLDLKRMIEGIIKVAPENQRVYKDNQLLEDNRELTDYGLTSATAKAQTPALLGLALRHDTNQPFESLEVTPFSAPPDLPEVMKGHDQNIPEAAA